MANKIILGSFFGHEDSFLLFLGGMFHDKAALYLSPNFKVSEAGFFHPLAADSKEFLISVNGSSQSLGRSIARRKIKVLAEEERKLYWWSFGPCVDAILCTAASTEDIRENLAPDKHFPIDLAAGDLKFDYRVSSYKRTIAKLEGSDLRNAEMLLTEYF